MKKKLKRSLLFTGLSSKNEVGNWGNMCSCVILVFGSWGM
jgi:hypothetical protein